MPFVFPINCYLWWVLLFRKCLNTYLLIGSSKLIIYFALSMWLFLYLVNFMSNHDFSHSYLSNSLSHPTCGKWAKSCAVLSWLPGLNNKIPPFLFLLLKRQETHLLCVIVLLRKAIQSWEWTTLVSCILELWLDLKCTRCTYCSQLLSFKSFYNIYFLSNFYRIYNCSESLSKWL